MLKYTYIDDPLDDPVSLGVSRDIKSHSNHFAARSLSIMGIDPPRLLTVSRLQPESSVDRWCKLAN